MAIRCQYCAAFSIELVLELPRRHGSRHLYHSYPHYEKMSDLCRSATSGCEMCQLMVASIKKERLSHHPNYCGRPDLYSYLLRKESQNQYACLELHLEAEIESGRHPTFKEMRLASMALEFVSLIFRLSTSRRMPSYPLVASRADQDVTAKGLIEEPFNIGDARFGQFRKAVVPCNHSLARMQLEECLESHEDCQQNDIPALPDRVIDVGATRWRLIDSRGMREKYIALSHCWGGQIELKLWGKTYDAFRGGLAISKLAENFQDAMEIARSLGIRYLWIDCLCIIQDSTTDWLEQSKECRVYTHTQP